MRSNDPASATAYKRAEDAHLQTQERFHFLVEGLKDYAVFTLDIEGRVTSWNRGVQCIFGYDEADFKGQQFSCIFTTEDIESGEPQRQLERAKAEGHARNERWHTRKDGTHFWATGTITSLYDETRLSHGFTIVMHDDTERRITQELNAHAALHDNLTGLPNRAFFIEYLTRAIARGKRHAEYLFAVLFLDLDGFKVINDRVGHVIADRLLVEIGRKLEAALRPEDVLARVGGDEFVIFLEDIRDSSDATRVANRIHEELLSPFNLLGSEVFISTSIGIALGARTYERPEECLRDADTALYRAKALGKARFEVFDNAMRDQADARLALETDLRRAIECQEFRVHYQPIFSLKTAQITGFEALLRWQHPKRGLIGPAEFISVADETRLIIPIGLWMLDEACRQTRIWQEQVNEGAELAISVNMSSKQFLQPDLIELIKSVLTETHFDPRRLKLDVTERVVTENAGETATIIRQLRELGVEIHVDDFGTGYSSLSYLRRFPISALKIDRSFVNRMNARDANSEIVRTIVALAHNLHMEVIAEGIETEEQASLLKSLQCEYGQGYCFSKPLDTESATNLITAQMRTGVLAARIRRIACES